MSTTSLATNKAQGLDIAAIRNEFPMLHKKINGMQLIYFDSASTSHKPMRVLNRLHQFYTEEYAKPNESHSLSQHVTAQMDEARKKVAQFINAKQPAEIVFSRGC